AASICCGSSTHSERGWVRTGGRRRGEGKGSDWRLSNAGFSASMLSWEPTQHCVLCRPTPVSIAKAPLIICSAGF
ncbi:hypothetical protein KUCAC02_036708, partial [Chaenocephalus aceratus]